MEISKTALKAEEWIPWEYEENPLHVIDNLRSQGYRIAALEKTESSIDIASQKSPEKICLILGHEVLGVSQELLTHADMVIHIPMHGKKESLNVAVATGIALYALGKAQKDVVSD